MNNIKITKICTENKSQKNNYKKLKISIKINRKLSFKNSFFVKN